MVYAHPVRGSVTVHIAAPPRQVWELVSDVTRIGEFSPETFEAEWIGGATGPGVGARFRGHVKRNGIGPTYWTSCTVIACEPGSEFAFVVGPSGKPLNTWRYRLEPAGAGTRLTVVESGFAQLPEDAHRTAFDGNTRGWASELGELTDYLDAAA